MTMPDGKKAPAFFQIDHETNQLVGVFILGHIVETAIVIGDPAAIETKVEFAVVALVFLAPRLLIAGDDADT